MSSSSAHDSRMYGVLVPSGAFCRIHPYATLAQSPCRNTYDAETPLLGHQQDLPERNDVPQRRNVTMPSKRFSTSPGFQARYRICQTVRNPAWNESIWSQITVLLSEGNFTALFLFLEINKNKSFQYHCFIAWLQWQQCSL